MVRFFWNLELKFNVYTREVNKRVQNLKSSKIIEFLTVLINNH